MSKLKARVRCKSGSARSMRSKALLNLYQRRMRARKRPCGWFYTLQEGHTLHRRAPRLFTLSHLTKAEISSLQYGPSGRHDRVRTQTLGPLHNCSGRGQRCSAGNSQWYQPSLNAVEQRLAQDYTLKHCFFPRVQTPCGHGAQVIVEGREERQMVENGTKTPKNQPKTKHPSPQADSTIL